MNGKKIGTSILLLCIVLISKAQTENNYRKMYLNSLSNTMKYYYTYVEQKKYDSLIHICKSSQQFNYDKIYNEDILFGLAASYAHLQKKDSSMKYILLYVKNRLDGGLTPFDIMQDYFFAEPLTNNTLLEEILFTEFNKSIKKENVLNEQAALEIYKLHHRDQQIRRKYNCQMAYSTSKESKQVADEEYERNDAKNEKLVMDLLLKNKGLYSPREVGNATTILNTLVYHISDIDFRNNYLGTYLKNALDNGTTSANNYVNQFCRTEQLNNSELYTRLGRKGITDSLCKIYHCQ